MTTIKFFRINIAGKKIEVECNHKYVFNKCRNYLTEFEEPDIIICIKENEINTVMKEVYHISNSQVITAEKVVTEYVEIESTILHKKLCEIMIHYNTILLHGAAISLDNSCYLFTAPSGTGKTTHILNWKKLFPKTVIINGDKPLINTTTKLVYGTPWCGKEGYNTNSSASLAGIIALERGESNSIKPISFHEMLPTLLQQTFIPKKRCLALKVYNLIGNFKDIPCYKLTCNMDEESARVAYDGIKANERLLRLSQ